MGNNEQNRGYWDNFKERYANNWIGAAKDALSKLELGFLNNYINVEKKQRILDVGVGNGRILENINSTSHKDSEIFGLDIADAMVKICKKKFADQSKIKSIQVCDISDEKIPFETFDLVSAIRVIKYNKDWIKIFKNVNNAMNLSGIFVFTVLNKNSLSRFADYGVPVFLTSKKEIEEVLEKTGFEMIEMKSLSRLPAFMFKVNNKLCSKLLLALEKALEVTFGKIFLGKELFIVAKKNR